MAATLVLVLLVGLLGLLAVIAGAAGSLSGSFVLSSTGTVILIGLAAIAVVDIVAIVLIVRRRPVGVLAALLSGTVSTAVLGWVATSMVSFSLPNSTALQITLVAATIAAAAGTIVLSLTYGRLLRIGRAQDAVGLRTF